MSKITTLKIQEMKDFDEKITMLAAYDFPMATVIDKAGIDIILVGDSVGMVLYGNPTTLNTTMEMVLRHTQAVSKAAKNAFVIGDMPFMSFALPEIALKNAGRFLQEGLADAVKLEGGKEREETVKLLTTNGIPVMGHIGLTPQYIHMLGGFKIQGKTAAMAEKLIEDAQILEKAGAFAIVLECIPWKISKRITESINIPTIGIGAGPYCGGQVLVAQDMMGFFEKTSFTFLKQYAHIHDIMKKATIEYIDDVKKGVFPTEENSFIIAEDEFKKFEKKTE